MTLEDVTMVTASDQQISCVVTGISQLTTVTWSGPDQQEISSALNSYTVDQGSLSGDKQQSLLTIPATILQNLVNTQSTHSFTCTVRSGQYPIDSADVTKSMTLTLLTFSVTPKPVEVEASTEAELSCVITGITQALTSVSWTDSSDQTLQNDNTNYVIVEGTYIPDSNSQTTSLTVINGVQTDTIFSCVVTSNEWNTNSQKTAVNFNVFGKN